MSAAQVRQLLQAIQEGKDTSKHETELSGIIDDLPKQPHFIDIGIACACRICSCVQKMKIETGKAII
jgi:hypothetical protein